MIGSVITAAISSPCSAKARSTASGSFHGSTSSELGDDAGHAGRAGHRGRVIGRAGAREIGVRREVDRVRPAVVVALEAHDQPPTRRGAGEAERVLHALRAGVAEAQQLDRGHARRDGVGGLALELVAEREVAAALVDRPGDRREQLGRAVAEDQRALAHLVVDVGGAVDVGDARAARLGDVDRRAPQPARGERVPEPTPPARCCWARSKSCCDCAVARRAVSRSSSCLLSVAEGPGSGVAARIGGGLGTGPQRVSRIGAAQRGCDERRDQGVARAERVDDLGGQRGLLDLFARAAGDAAAATERRDGDACAVRDGLGGGPSVPREEGDLEMGCEPGSEVGIPDVAEVVRERDAGRAQHRRARDGVRLTGEVHPAIPAQLVRDALGDAVLGGDAVLLEQEAALAALELHERDAASAPGRTSMPPTPTPAARACSTIERPSSSSPTAP